MSTIGKQVRKPTPKSAIFRFLHQGEATGYEVYRFLNAKGVKTWPNHVYATLSEMERAGLLKGRWINNPSGKGPRKHLYSLSDNGESEYAELVRESLDILIGEFVHSNLKQDAREHVDFARRLFGYVGVPITDGTEAKLVVAIPDPDPIACYPIYFEALSEAFPNASIYVVKAREARLGLEPRPNLTVLDGWRHNMPLKDGFADCLAVQGFPKEVSEEETIAECARVLKDDGHLVIQVSEIMTEEKGPRGSFADFAMQLFYDYSGFDRPINVNHVKLLLSKSFGKVTDTQAFQRVIFHATGKRQERVSERVVQRAKKPQYSHAD